MAPERLLVELLAGLPDPRARRGKRHPLAALLAVAVCAVLTGARGFTAIAEWAKDAGIARLKPLGMTRAVADESTFRRVLGRVDPAVLDRVLGVWATTRAGRIDGRRVYAIDGKAVRGARKRGAAAAFLVAAFDHATGMVAGQVAIGAKDSEITAARTLIGLCDVAGAVVTMDALHTNAATAKAVAEAGAFYLLTVKGNAKTLHPLLKRLPWKTVPAYSSVEVRRGRRVRRTIKVLQAPPWCQFEGALQVAQLRRTTTVKNKRTTEVVYLVTSADVRTAPPKTLATWATGHWGIENRLHWVRDVTFDEDRSQIHVGNAPTVMASLRNTAIAILRAAGWDNIAHATRHHARDLDRPVTALLTA